MTAYPIEGDVSGPETPPSNACQTFAYAEALRRFIGRVWSLWLRLECRLDRWRERWQLLGADEGLLKDIGLSRCGVDWAVRHGRDTDPVS
jgi:uncharacterized protein YjiS (DUF1127 family)